MTEGNFKEIVEGIQRRDVQKEKELYTILYERLFRICLLYSSDKQEATSVFNFSALDIFKKVDDFNSLDELLRWSRSVIKNDCIDHIRKKTTYKEILKINATDSKNYQLLNEAISIMSIKEIYTCIKKLSDNKRACFVMYEIDGMSHKEISVALGINLNTSKWYLAEAKKQLQKMISDDGISETLNSQTIEK